MCKVVFTGNCPRDPYVPTIHAYMVQEFPGIIKATTPVLLDALTEELVSTGQVRFGPKPNPESMVVLRKVLTNSMEKGTPIPILVPSGPKKPRSGQSIDLAELFTLKTLANLQARISALHKPGVIFYVRLEDLTGFVLEKHEPKIREDIARYTGDFSKLVTILGYDSFVKPVLESSIITEEAYAKSIDKITGPLRNFIRATDTIGHSDISALPDYDDLLALGWKGSIPQEQRDFYREKYRGLYPNFSEEEITSLMVAYFATTWARYQLGATGMPKEDLPSHIQMNFAPQVPGIPSGFASNRVYYRTLPLYMCKHNMPFWRAKGYFKITSEDDIKPSLESWKADIDYNKFSITLEEGDLKVQVAADYVVV